MYVFAVHINQARGHHDDLGVLASAQVGQRACTQMDIPSRQTCTPSCVDRDPDTYATISEHAI